MTERAGGTSGAGGDAFPDGRESGRASGSDGLPWVWSEAYEADIGPHVFPTVKYRQVKDVLLAEGTLRREDLVRPGPASWERLARVHDTSYLEKIRERRFSRREELTLEVPLTDEFVLASRVCASGTTLAGRRALEGGVCLHLGGGFHHAFRDHGEGFCLLNDVAVALRTLLDEERLGRAAVVDCDVHHGNGTASIFADEPAVFTFSLHQENNYPLHKPPGDLDVGLPDGVGDEDYLAILADRLDEVLRAHRPELVVYLAGADPYREDQLGGLSLTKRGLRRRDDAVLAACRRAGAAVAVCLAGGYAVRLEDTREIHAGTGRACAAAWAALRGDGADAGAGRTGRAGTERADYGRG